MKSIWKFPLALAATFTVKMPRGAVIRTLQTQNQYGRSMPVACIWAEVSPNEPIVEMRTFAVYGTGHDMPDEPGVYIGTYQSDGGAFVWHVYETTNLKKEA